MDDAVASGGGFLIIVDAATREISGVISSRPISGFFSLGPVVIGGLIETSLLEGLPSNGG